MVSEVLGGAMRSGGRRVPCEEFEKKRNRSVQMSRIWGLGRPNPVLRKRWGPFAQVLRDSDSTVSFSRKSLFTSFSKSLAKAFYSSLSDLMTKSATIAT